LATRVHAVQATRTLERRRFRLAVADDGCDEQVRIVEGRAKGVREDVAELAALVDRSGRGRADVARHTLRRGKLPEETLHPGGVLADLRIRLAPGSFQPDVGIDRGAAVSGTDEQ
jgi:hypothetical protein